MPSAAQGMGNIKIAPHDQIKWKPQDMLATHLACITGTPLEHARVVVPWHVPHAAQGIVDVLAKRGGIGAVLAATDAELGSGHKVRPFVQLLELAEGAREDESANGVACDAFLHASISIASESSYVTEETHHFRQRHGGRARRPHPQLGC